MNKTHQARCVLNKCTPMNAGLPNLIQGLLRPEAFPHRVDVLRVQETHISWVLLTGQRAYKIKKPIRLDFLDYSTLERRRACCELELQLNQRLAPELYLDVVPISGPPERPRVDGRGPAIEYAVRMREFPQDCLASRMIERGAFGPREIDQLAETVSSFHKRAAVAECSSRFGTPTVIRREAFENLDVLERLTDDRQLQEKLLQLRNWTASACESHAMQFAKRLETGQVRECHGDMHLGNMALYEGRIVVFDGIEFSDELRWMDVISEASFVVMDLDERGRIDLARRFLDAYLSGTGDYYGLAVCRFYLVYRALVRAKVTAIQLAQKPTDDADTPAATVKLRAYIDLAVALTTSDAPRLTITHGPSGSGKTTGTQPLLEKTGAVRVRSDIERKRLAGIRTGDPAIAPPGAGIYTDEWTRLTYDRLADCTRRILAAGFPVIVDATFLDRRQRNRFRRLAAEHGVPFEILDFTINEQKLRQRVAERRRLGHDTSDADEQVLTRQLQSRDPLSDSERQLVVQTAQDVN